MKKQDFSNQDTQVGSPLEALLDCLEGETSGVNGIAGDEEKLGDEDLQELMDEEEANDDADVNNDDSEDIATDTAESSDDNGCDD